jgi:hypothetical protein
MAITGGKRREQRPVSFDDKVVNVGDFLTYASGSVTRGVLIGQGSVLPLNDSVVVGPNIQMVWDNGGSGVAVGANLVIPGFTNTVAVGGNIAVGTSFNSILIGHNLSSDLGWPSIFIGNGITLTSWGYSNIVLGAYGSTNLIECSYNFVVNSTYGNVSLPNNSYGNIILPGEWVRGIEIPVTPENNQYRVLIGNGHYMGAGDRIILVGSDCECRSYQSVAMGCYATIDLSSPLSLAIGASAARIGKNCTNSTAVGSFVYIGDNSERSLSVGFATNIGDNCPNNIVVGDRIFVHYGSQNASAVGHDLILGSASASAHGSLENADPNQFTNNDYITFPDGAGGTINVELQLDGSFVPTPGMFTADLQLAVTAEDVSNIIASIVFANSTLQDLSSGAQGIGWVHNYQYSTPGTVGNGQQIIPTVINGASAAVGSTFTGGITGSTSNTCVLGTTIRVGPESRLNNVIGSYISLGAATLAFGTFENAGPGQFVDNDYITFPDGSGGTINVELQLTGTFVPTPGMFTADLQLAATAQDISDIIANVVFANSTLQDLNNSVAHGIGWTHTYGYSTTGTVGNGQQIIPTVTNGAAAAIGSTFNNGANASPTNNCSAMGDHITITPNSDSSVMIGNLLTTGTDNSYSVIVGAGITLAQADWWSVVLGSINTMGFASPACVLIGRQSSIGEHSFNSIVMGTSSTIKDNAAFCTVLGSNNTLGNGHVGGYSQCTILGAGNVIADDNTSVHEHGLALNVLGISSYVFLAGTFNTLTTPGIDVAIGTAIVATVTNSVLVGDNLTTTTGSGDTLVLIGTYISTDGRCTSNVCVGSQIALDGDVLDAYYNVFLGYWIAATEPHNTIALGDHITIGLQAQSCLAVGPSSTIGASLTAAIAIGPSTNASGSYAIALGASAAASANTMIVGDNASATTAIHQFAVRGYSGGVLDTISAIDNPAVAGETGLTLTYYDGANVSNKTLKASTLALLPANSLVIYVDP